MLAVDGPSGSGKTTFAEAIAERVPDARVLHVDDLLDGWEGLPGVPRSLDALLRPLAGGAPGRYLHYDWVQGRFTHEVSVEPTPLLVLDGVGSGCVEIADLVTVLVWLEVDDDVRRDRALARDGEALLPHWDAWQRAERTHHAVHRTRERADLTF